MPGTRALIVGETGGAADEVGHALSSDGIEVAHCTPIELAARREPRFQPDLLLIAASVGLRQLARVSQRFESTGEPPTTVVFSDGDLAALEACVRAGFDYVVPPYLPSLMRTRVSSCWERRELASTVEEMTAAASLREYERELSIAHEIQAGFLPEELPAPPGWEVAARFEPAQSVGGDFYDVFELLDGRRLAFVVADVCDKGVGAALFMALIRTLVRHTAEHTGRQSLFIGDMEAAARSLTAGDILAAGNDLAASPTLSVAAQPLVQAVVGTNQYLARNHLRQGYFATMFFGVLDPESGTLLYINGGHNPPLLLRKRGGHIMLQPTGPAVGMVPDSEFMLAHTTMEPGDTLFAYTDGVVEARDTAGEMFGTDRMIEVVTAPGSSAEELLTGADASLQHHMGTADQWDDITMLALHWKD
ncbi:PP2C family protein-serine/threonine phosphatase [Actinomadura barringtoniae]|uniref:PP2C family protein-serine/threonine phosphatase n=1 Tax=Actinomadura barringtoniae TaxID=1427535 RepID=A0A939PFG9_9ACTN|nr:PP2C family protein-serine/threonine phosphatase [Actinomadura barringtoniae]MBO2448754.1 PP2C family protein-serine/threonine phosphatase [Actinomadura barringtoniae]